MQKGMMGIMERKILCNEKSTVKDALNKINESGKGIVFIVDDKDVLKGLVTDGDVRRGLLKGVTLDAQVSDIESRKFVYAYDTEKTEDVLKKFNEKVKIIPIVNEKMQVVDYCEYNNRMKLAIAQPQLNGKELEYLLDGFLSTWISSTGKYVTQFEQKFSDYCGVSYGVATSNGTTALHLALTALGIGVGDEVIVPDITFAATINAVLYTGATPVIVDIEEDGWCIDPDEIEKAVTPKTKAIIPVHIYGQPCDMGRIMDIAKVHNLYVVEDCAEAHGAMYKGKKVGSFGDIGCFSFFGNKVITTGEGGMCITSDGELEKKMKLYRDHGMSKERRYYHEVVGFNYRMTNLQAAIGVAQLENIDKTLKWREELENLYREKLKNIAEIRVQRNDLKDRKKITWLVTVYTETEEKRNICMNSMMDADIDVRPFFIPLSEMEIYKKYVFSNRVSKEISKRGFNLPTSYVIGEKEIERVIAALKRAIGK